MKKGSPEYNQFYHYALKQLAIAENYFIQKRHRLQLEYGMRKRIEKEELGRYMEGVKIRLSRESLSKFGTPIWY